jgi:hypothetical protein
VKLVPYGPDRFAVLERAAARLDDRTSLRHRGFVDHYYAGSPYCQLQLALGEEGDVVGMVGIEWMPFETEAGAIQLGFGSNFNALVGGVGGLLYLQWLKSCPAGIIFGSSEDAQRIYRHEGWSFYAPVPIYELNSAYADRAGEGLLRRAGKTLLRRLHRAPLPTHTSRLGPAARELELREETSYSEDLLPQRSPFSFRFAPSVEHLAWRYATDLDFVRYRVFRVLVAGATRGYVVLNESPERILVAHCDGEDPGTLAHGILRAVLLVGAADQVPRTVVIAATHPTMRMVFEGFGFRKTVERPFAIGSLRARPELGDPRGWLVSFDWGDNGLRPPFLDQPRS